MSDEEIIKCFYCGKNFETAFYPCYPELDGPHPICDCKKRLKIIPKRYFIILQNNFNEKLIRPLIIKYINELKDNIKKGIDLVLIGKSGTGKSISASYVINEALKLYVNVAFIECTREQVFLLDNEYRIKRLVELEKVSLLCLDNYGKDTTPVSKTFWTGLIESRKSQMLSTIFTINEDAVEIEKNLDSMVVDRLRAKENIIEIYKGQSLR